QTVSRPARVLLYGTYVESRGLRATPAQMSPIPRHPLQRTCRWTDGHPRPLVLVHLLAQGLLPLPLPLSHLIPASATEENDHGSERSAEGRADHVRSGDPIRAARGR